MTGCIIPLFGQRVSVINTPPLITRHDVRSHTNESKLARLCQFSFVSLPRPCLAISGALCARPPTPPSSPAICGQECKFARFVCLRSCLHRRRHEFLSCLSAESLSLSLSHIYTHRSADEFSGTSDRSRPPPWFACRVVSKFMVNLVTGPFLRSNWPDNVAVSPSYPLPGEGVATLTLSTPDLNDESPERERESPGRRFLIA